MDKPDKNKRILVIEDNPYNREITQLSLENAGFEVVLANDGIEGLEKLDKSIDLILLDLSLPKLSGKEVINKIRENPEYNELPVIALTAHAMVGDREKAIEMGCNSYLSKPCMPDDIIKEIRTFLG